MPKTSGVWCLSHAPHQGRGVAASLAALSWQLYKMLTYFCVVAYCGWSCGTPCGLHKNGQRNCTKIVFCLIAKKLPRLGVGWPPPAPAPSWSHLLRLCSFRGTASFRPAVAYCSTFPPSFCDAGRRAKRTETIGTKSGQSVVPLFAGFYVRFCTFLDFLRIKSNLFGFFRKKGLILLCVCGIL